MTPRLSIYIYGESSKHKLEEELYKTCFSSLNDVFFEKKKIRIKFQNGKNLRHHLTHADPSDDERTEDLGFGQKVLQREI